MCGVRSHQLRREMRSVVEHHFDALRVRDHVIIGDDIAARVDDDAVADRARARRRDIDLHDGGFDLRDDCFLRRLYGAWSRP